VRNSAFTGEIIENYFSSSTVRKFNWIYIVIAFLSCRPGDKKCNSNYEGIYVVDTTNLYDDYKKIIIERGWINIQLNAHNNGTFTINTKDPDLIKCEGRWYSTYNSEDANCILHYRQVNYLGYSSTFTFTINSVFNDSPRFVIPFRKK
jgi:hypothetical protein